MGKILIVEDEEVTRNGLKNMIESIDNSVEVLETGFAAEALKYATKEKIDAFILDIQLEDFSGIELAKRLREMDLYKLVPIIFITAMPTRELIAFKEIHCYDYIIKPFKKEEVLEVFKTIIFNGVREDKVKLKLKQKNYTLVLEVDEIIYLESINKKIHIVTLNEQVDVSTYTINKLLNELSSKFIQCHKGFVINSDYIYKIDKASNLIYLKDIENSIPLGRKYRQFFEGKYI